MDTTDSNDVSSLHFLNSTGLSPQRHDWNRSHQINCCTGCASKTQPHVPSLLVWISKRWVRDDEVTREHDTSTSFGS